jgi:hypothetical protein
MKLSFLGRIMDMARFYYELPFHSAEMVRLHQCLALTELADIYIIVCIVFSLSIKSISLLSADDTRG